MILLNISIIIKLLSVFLILFVLLPRRLFKPAPGNSFLDTFFVNLIHMVFITILLVPFLVIIKMYEPLTLVFSYLLIFSMPTIYSLYKQGSVKDRLEHYKTVLTSYILDTLDRHINPWSQLKGYLTRVFMNLKEELKRIDKITAIYILFFVGIFGYAAYLRLYDSFCHLTIGTSDPYPMVKAIKNLERNYLFSETIYPESHSVVLSVFHLLSFLDLTHIFRFFGPLMSLVLVLSAYYAVFKMTSNRWAALITAFIYGTFTTDQLPSELYRQTTTLEQEFAMIFLLPSLLFLIQYLSTKERRYLVLFFEALVILFKVHSLVAIAAFLGVVGISIAGLINRVWDKRTLLRVSLAGIAAIGLGHLTILIGLMMGYKIHRGGLGMITLFAPQRTLGYLTLSPLLWVITFLALFTLGYGFFSRSKQKMGYLSFGLFYLLLTFEYQANFFHLRHIMEQFRTGHFLALSGTVVAGLCFHLIISKWLKNRLLSHRGLYPAITLGTLFILGVAFPAKPPVTWKMGYDAAMANYLRISQRYPPLQWLIVSQVEEYPLALYKGWHMMTFDFLERYSPFEDELPIDTPHIFFFVEKEIFKIKAAPRTQEDYDWRWDQMRRMEEWCQTYMFYHDDMDVFYKDDKFVVYAIHKKTGLEPIMPPKKREGDSLGN